MWILSCLLLIAFFTQLAFYFGGGLVKQVTEDSIKLRESNRENNKVLKQALLEGRVEEARLKASELKKSSKLIAFFPLALGLINLIVVAWLLYCLVPMAFGGYTLETGISLPTASGFRPWLGARGVLFYLFLLSGLAIAFLDRRNK